MYLGLLFPILYQFTSTMAVTANDGKVPLYVINSLIKLSKYTYPYDSMGYILHIHMVARYRFSCFETGFWRNILGLLFPILHPFLRELWL